MVKLFSDKRILWQTLVLMANPQSSTRSRRCPQDEHYGSVLWRDVSRNGIFWCPFVVLGIGYWVFGIRVYTYIHITYIHIHIYILYIYISIEYWVWVYIQYAWLSMDDGGRLWYDITWSVIMKKHMAQTKTQYQYAWLSMGDGGMLW